VKSARRNTEADSGKEAEMESDTGDRANLQNVRETNPAVRGLDLSSYLLIPSKSPTLSFSIHLSQSYSAS
jgi:hypothetical protein